MKTQTQKKSKPKAKILKLFKNQEEQDIILSRLYAVNDILNRYEEEDDYLDLVQTKIIEAIDWYSRYCDEHGFELLKTKKKQ